MERLPNLISCFRIVLSVTLLLLIDKPTLFAISYFLCGISDVLDGYLARRLSVETTLGIKLDSVGDFTFYAVWLFMLLTFVNNGDGGLIVTCVIIITIIRVANLMITKAKFKQWSVMHTIGNKLTGFALFLMLPICVLTDGVQSWNIIIVSLVAALSSLEESVILLNNKTYDANKRSFFF